jgi:hypothetical protein
LATPSATITPTPPAAHHSPTTTPTPGTGTATLPQRAPMSGPPPDQVFGPPPPFKALPAAPGPVPPVASGRPSASNPAAGPLVSCGGTAPTVSIEQNPSWDLLGLYVTAVPASGCSPTAYYYDVSWNGAAYQRFAPNTAYGATYRPESFAWLDTNTHTGTAQVAVQACDASSCSNPGYTPVESLSAHGKSCAQDGCWVDNGSGINAQNTCNYSPTRLARMLRGQPAPFVRYPGQDMQPDSHSLPRAGREPQHVSHTSLHLAQVVGVGEQLQFRYTYRRQRQRVYEGIGCPNCQGLLTASISGLGIGIGSNTIYGSTEITTHSPIIGDLLNFGMFINDWFQREYYSLDGSTWTEFPSPNSGIALGGSCAPPLKCGSFGQGNNLYCDRPFGSELFSYGTYYQSGFLYSMNLRASGSCR